MISWDDPEWGHNPIHESGTGSWLEAESDD